MRCTLFDRLYFGERVRITDAGRAALKLKQAIDHRQDCPECRAEMAENNERAKNAPIIDWDLEEESEA